MISKKARVFIGTSGWSYSHWKENFYPHKLATTKWLNYYATFFSTVELNTTFYGLPSIKTIKKWMTDVPSDFHFSIKASRYITHQKRLHDCGESLEIFFKVIKEFGPKTGPFLFQLPPSFKINLDRLVEFISLLKKEYAYVFEFRHDTWFVQEIYDLLMKNNIALCLTDLNGELSPEEITADFTYIRLHGPKKAYQGSYGEKSLKDWKNKIENWKKHHISTYCYFDNDEKGYAIQDAKELSHLCLD